MREMTAKYPGRCARCGKAIAVGAPIYWTKENGKRGQAWHKECDATDATKTERAPDAAPDATPETPPTPEPKAPSVKVAAAPLPESREMDHPLFAVAAAIVESGANLYLHSSPGSGKSHAFEAMADRMERPYRYVSLSPQSMPSLLMGYMDAQGRYVRTGFRDIYEHGGIYCIDEVDNANANLLAALNSALANGVAEFPDAQIERHAECVIGATGNTPGNGPTLAFPERRPLDRAFRDRFVFLEWTYAPEHERAIARMIGDQSNWTLSDAWADWIHRVRAYCAKSFPALTCSPRSIYAAVDARKGPSLLSRLDAEQVAHAVLFQGVADATVRAKILEACPLPQIERVES